MDKSLQELIEMMPPPENPRNQRVDWERLEERVGLPYPESFKEYVAVYGGSRWFDLFSPYYAAAENDDDIDKYLHLVSVHVSRMRGNMRKWGSFEKLAMPLYPEKGGLLPFMLDYDSGLCSWKTSNPDPDKWPVVCWIDHKIAELRGISIAGMFLEWLHGSRRIRKVWGDIKNIEPHRICVDRD